MIDFKFLGYLNIYNKMENNVIIKLLSNIMRNLKIFLQSALLNNILKI